MKLETLNKELEEIFSTIEHGEDGGIYIACADWLSEKLSLQFVVKTGVEGQDQLWKVEIGGVSDEMIKTDIAEKIELFEDHPLLMAHSQIQTSLYFGTKTSRPYELFVNIFSIHTRFTRNWIPFDKYINTNVSIIDLCKSSSGLFAKGPLKLLEEYKKELELHGMNPTIVGGHNPQRWVNGHEVDETEIVNALVIGRSYVIGESFEYSRIS